MTTLLRCASSLSFMTGSMGPRELCEKAALRGILHLGLCDWGGLYALPAFALEAERCGLHALFGVELGSGTARLALIARDEQGWRSLTRIVSAYRLDAAQELSQGGSLCHPRGEMDFLCRLLEREAKGLWLLCDQEPLLVELVRRIGSDDLRIALPPLLGFQHARPGEEEGVVHLPFPSASRGGASSRGRVSFSADLRAHVAQDFPLEQENTDPASRKVPDPSPFPNRMRLVELAKRHGIELAAVPWVVYGEARERSRHRLLVAVKKGRLWDQVREAELAWPGSFMPSQEELEEGYADYPQSLREAERMALACSLSLTRPRPLVFPSAAGVMGVANDADEQEQKQRAGALLRARSEAGLFRRYDGMRTEPAQRARLAAARRRLEKELKVICELGFAGYFLVVDEIVALAREHGIPCMGRGSAADSLVSYCLGFTDADPLRYGLCFERFLNAERFARGEGDALPDIDLDFCWRRRDQLLELVTQRFGKDRVALLCTQPALGFRAAYREAARTMGLPLDEVDRRSHGLPRCVPDDLLLRGRSGDFSVLEKLLQRTPEFRARMARLAGGPQEALREARIWWGAFGLTGMHRCLGLHPGGTVLAPGPLRDYAPLERSAKGINCLQWDKHVAPRMGLVKIDLLGNRGLSVFADAKQELVRLGASDEVLEDLDRTPEEDPQVAEILRRGRTIGCFQIESPGMRSLMTRMDAQKLDEVIQAIALIRPGPAGCGMLERYVKRVRGDEVVPELPKGVEAILGPSRGVMLYQEDVILVLAALTGFSPGQADLMRRGMGKEPGLEKKYLEAVRKRGVPMKLAREFWAQIARFAGFSFNKAHAVTYGRLAWRILRIKQREPAALLAAMLANDTGYYRKRVYVEEAKRLGVPVLPPCVNRSKLCFQTERQGALGRAAMRVGLGDVRELPRDFLAALMREREDRGPFFSVEDFVARLEERGQRVHEAWIERLILVGAFDLLEGTRPEKLWRFRIDFSRRRRGARGSRGVTGASGAAYASAVPFPDALFPDALLPAAPVIPCLPDFDEKQRARIEIELLGYSTGCHPLDLAEPLTESLTGPLAGEEAGFLPLLDAAARIGQEITVLAWHAAQRRFKTRRGEWMCFLTLEDRTGVLEAVLFPQVFRRFGGELAGEGKYLLRGKVECREGAVALHVDYLERVGGNGD